MNDLIPRDEALRVLEQRLAGARKRLQRRQEWQRQNERPYDDGISAWFKGTSVAYENAASDLRAIPAIGTCATCADWDALGWTPERGMCTADVYRSESTLITPPDHSCAAWRDPIAAITEHPIMRDNREALRMLRERDGR